jgi:hypothetical protein
MDGTNVNSGARWSTSLRPGGITPFAGGGPLLAAMLAGLAYEEIVTAGVLRPPRRQGLHDRLAHILVMDGKEPCYGRHGTSPKSSELARSRQRRSASSFVSPVS